MAEKVFTLKEMIEEQSSKVISEAKQIALALLGDDDFASMAKKTGKDESELKEIFDSTLRRALMHSDYPDDGSYTVEQYKKMVNNLRG